MLSDFESWLESGATAAAVLLIPIYMGLIHVNPGAAIAYAGVGGLAMAVGEEMQFRATPRQLSLWDVALWALAIAGIGGIGYGLALLLI